MKFKQNEFVRIKKYPEDSPDAKGRICSITKDGLYWVSNMNMPFYGTVSDFFTENQLEKIKRK